MKKKIILNLAMSLDGYIAKRDHSVELIMGDGSEPNVTMADMGYNSFLGDIKSIIMGSKSYEITKSFAPLHQQFPGIDITVMTSRDIVNDTNLHRSNQSVEEVIKDLQEPIWLFGGSQLIKSFMEKDIVTNLEISLIPITLGKGIKLFLENEMEIKWKFTSQNVYNGIVILKYKRREND